MTASQNGPATFQDGAWLDLEFENYLRADAASKSFLDKVHRAPALAKFYMDNEQCAERTKAQRIGNLIHTATLEPSKARLITHPETYPAKGISKPWNWNANYCKDWRKDVESGGREVISKDELSQLFGIQNAVHSHPFAAELLKGAKTEVSVFVKHERTGIQRKIRIDILPALHAAFADLKTCEDASFWAVFRDVRKWRYHVQAAFYSDAWNDLNPGDQRHQWFNIFVEKKPPYLVAVYSLAEFEDGIIPLEIGREAYEEDLDTLKHCMETGIWPGYDQPYRVINWRSGKG